MFAGVSKEIDISTNNLITNLIIPRFRHYPQEGLY